MPCSSTPLIRAARAAMPPGRPDRRPHLLSLIADGARRVRGRMSARDLARLLRRLPPACIASTGRLSPAWSARSYQASAAVTIRAPDSVGRQLVGPAADRVRVEQGKDQGRDGDHLARPAQPMRQRHRRRRADPPATGCGQGRSGPGSGACSAWPARFVRGRARLRWDPFPRPSRRIPFRTGNR